MKPIFLPDYPQKEIHSPIYYGLFMVASTPPKYSKLDQFQSQAALPRRTGRHLFILSAPLIRVAQSRSPKRVRTARYLFISSRALGLLRHHIQVSHDPIAPPEAGRPPLQELDHTLRYPEPSPPKPLKRICQAQGLLIAPDTRDRQLDRQVNHFHVLRQPAHRVIGEDQPLTPASRP